MRKKHTSPIILSGQTHTLILVIFLVVLNGFTAKNAKFIAKNAKFIAKNAMVVLRSSRVLSEQVRLRSPHRLAVKFLKSYHQYSFQSKVCVCPEFMFLPFFVFGKNMYICKQLTL